MIALAVGLMVLGLLQVVGFRNILRVERRWHVVVVNLIITVAAIVVLTLSAVALVLA
jgi:hypothetical protein